VELGLVPRLQRPIILRRVPEPRLAAELHAATADHLEHVSQPLRHQALAAAGTVAC